MEAHSRENDVANSLLNFLDDASNPTSFDVVESTPEGLLVNKRISLRGLIDWANDREVQESASSSVSTFKLIEINCREDVHDHPLVSRSISDAIFDAFRIGHWLKRLTLGRDCGFFYSHEGATNDIWTFMLNVGSGTAVWSFSTTTGSTRGIFYGFPGHWSLFHQRMTSYATTSCHPFFPGFASALVGAKYAADTLTAQYIALNAVEIATGYRALGYLDFYEAAEGDEVRSLGELSKDVAAISNTVAMTWYNLITATQILELLSACPTHPLATQRALWDDVAGVAHCVLAEVKYEEGYRAVMEKRVGNQLTIIFNLIAQQDTAATIELAKAAKHDSSSMKTLAVMTMAFLPATFLASVFAMPSLVLDQPPGFNVYLAISIPTTIAILLGWAAITQRQAIRESLQGVSLRRPSSKPKDLNSDIEMVPMGSQSQRGVVGRARR